jgi:MFS family permease
VASRPASGISFRPALPTGLLLGAAAFCANGSWQIVLPVLPIHLSHIGYTPAQIGVLMSVLGATMGAVELQAGPVVTALGRRRTLTGGYAANALCLVLAGASRTTAPVAAALAAIGVARGMIVPPLHATIAEASTVHTRGRMFGLLWFCGSAGTVVGPVLGGVIAATYGDRAPFHAGAVCGMLALPIVATAAAVKRASPRVPLREVADLLRDPAVLRLCAACLLCFSITGLWSTFLPLYIARQGISVAVVGWVFGAQGSLYTLMQMPTGHLAGRRGAEWLPAAGIVGMGGTALLSPFFHTPPAFIAAGAVYGAAFGLIPVTFATRVTRLMPRGDYTTAMGVYNSAIDLGLCLGPLLGGLIGATRIVPPLYLALPLGLGALTMSLGAMHSEGARAVGG